MKNIWDKTPAWLKAILLNVFWLYPTIIAAQLLIQINVQSESKWGWGLAVVILLLVVFWILAKRFGPKSNSEVELSLSFGYRKPISWLLFVGLLFSVPAILLLSIHLFDVQSVSQFTFISSFKALAPSLALPLLLALAMSAGVVAEVVYRCFIQNTLTNKYAKAISFPLIAVLFTVLHFLPLAMMLPYMVISLLFSLVADKCKATGVAIYAHILVDLIIFILIYHGLVDLAEVTSQMLTKILIMLAVGLSALAFGLTRKTMNRQT